MYLRVVMESIIVLNFTAKMDALGLILFSFPTSNLSDRAVSLLLSAHILPLPPVESYQHEGILQLGQGGLGRGDVVDEKPDRKRIFNQQC